MTDAVRLHETVHPSKNGADAFERLVGIEDQKEKLRAELAIFFNPQRMSTWLKTHHRKGLPFLERKLHPSPLFALSGEVGCGKTELAMCVATPVATELQKQILVLESPSDIRGSGLVGEVSARITETFRMATAKAEKNPTILVIDEADDIATSRSQNQAHHEDRAGLNVLIKQIDRIARDRTQLAVILITNRDQVLDPAIKRRAETQLFFARPTGPALKTLIPTILNGVPVSAREVDLVVAACEAGKVPYSFSDLINRVGKAAMREAVAKDVPLTAELFADVLRHTAPTPLLG